MKQTNLLSQKPSRWIALILTYAILASSTGIAQPRQPAPEAVRTCVLKLGVGQWVRVREQNGATLKGEITGIGPQVFQIEQRDAVTPTDVYYADVAKIRCASSERLRGPNGGSVAGPIVATAFLIGILVCAKETCLK